MVWLGRRSKRLPLLFLRCPTQLLIPRFPILVFMLLSKKLSCIPLNPFAASAFMPCKLKLFCRDELFCRDGLLCRDALFCRDELFCRDGLPWLAEFWF